MRKMHTGKVALFESDTYIIREGPYAKRNINQSNNTQ